MLASEKLMHVHITVTLEHKTSHKGQYFEIEMYASSESGLNNLRVQKNLNIEKIIFKVVQIKFLAMHITNQKLCL